MNGKAAPEEYPRSESSRLSWVNHLVIPLGIFAFLAILFERYDWDTLLSDPFYNPVTKRWPLRSDFFFYKVVHEGGRITIVVAAVLATLGAITAQWIPFCKRHQRTLIYFILVLGLTTGSVAGLKRLTHRPCPWNVTQYGGEIIHRGLFSSLDAPTRGSCFPASHSSSAFALFSLYFIFRHRNSRIARLALVYALVLGTLFSYAQLVRGAHFASHNIWSAMIGWLVALGLYCWPFKMRV